MLITAGDENRHNAMTASWGGVGELWGKYVSTIYIRPQRYTLESWNGRAITPCASSGRSTARP